MLLEILVMIGGFVPLGFAIATSRRWLRILLALAAAFYLIVCVQMSLYVSDRRHEEGISTFQALLAVIYSISAIVAIVLIFVPTDGGASTKQFSPDNEDLKPRR